MRVAYPGGLEQVPGGAIALDGNPFAAAPWSIRVEQNGSPVLLAKVNRDPLLPGSRLMRPSVTVDNAFAPAPVTVAPPLAIEGDLAAREITAVRAYSPADPTQIVAGFERTETGFRLTTPAGSEDVAGGTLQYTGDPIAGDDATFRLVGAPGAPSLSIDRATGAVVVDGVGDEPVTLAGPVAYAGDPTNPSLIAVASPAGATPVLRYERGADGMGSLALNGETVVPSTRFLSLEGDPRAAGFAIVLKGADGKVAKRFEVDAYAAALDRALPESERRAIVGILAPGAEAPRGLVDVRDAAGNLADAEALLAGGSWLGLAAPHTARVALAANDDDWTRITLAQDDGIPATFTRALDGETRLYEAAFRTAAPHGGEARLRVRYERETTPFVVQAIEETGYSYRVDGRGPSASILAPSSSNESAFLVRWSGADAESGLASFAVDRRAGDGAWERWLDGVRDSSAKFTGEPGIQYSFRARASDLAGNVGAWSAVAKAMVDEAAEPTASPPTVLLVSPEGGETLSGLVHVSWESADADGDAPMVNLYASRDGGRTWKSLYSGLDGGFDWDTTKELDGANWKLRVVATDGARDALDATGRFTIRNLVTAPSVPPLPGGDGASGGDGTGGTGGASGGDGSAPSESPEGTRGAENGESGLTEAVASKGLVIALVIGGIALAGAIAFVAMRRR